MDTNFDMQLASSLKVSRQGMYRYVSLLRILRPDQTKTVYSILAQTPAIILFQTFHWQTRCGGATEKLQRPFENKHEYIQYRHDYVTTDCENGCHRDSYATPAMDNLRNKRVTQEVKNGGITCASKSITNRYSSDGPTTEHQCH